VLLGGNTNIYYKLKLVVIHHAQSPKSLRGFLKYSPSVYWWSTKKRRMSNPIFTKQFHQQQHHEVKTDCKTKNTVFIFVGYTPGYLTEIETLSRYIKVVLLPPNMSFLQLTDQKVVARSRLMTFEVRLLHSQRQWMAKTNPVWRNSGKFSTSNMPQTS
jgi:hypothetical protein